MIEVTIAVALIATILVSVLAMARILTKTIAVVGAMRLDSEMLRQGIVLALEDADFWHSAANPDPPWSMRVNSEQNVDFDGNVSSGPVDDAANKRPFRRVVFSRSADPDTSFAGKVPNPNAMLIHDQRSWYRGHLQGNTRTFKDGGGYFSNMRSPDNTRYQDQWTGVPPTWSPLQVYGDYALTSHTEMGAAADPDRSFVSEAVNERMSGPGGYRPNLALNLYRTLGPNGIFNYVPMSTIMVMQRHDRTRDLRPGTSSGQIGYAPDALTDGITTHAAQEKMYDLGEVPWALDGELPIGSGTWDWPYDWGHPNRTKGVAHASPRFHLNQVKNATCYADLLFAVSPINNLYFIASDTDAYCLPGSMKDPWLVPAGLGYIQRNTQDRIFFPVMRPYKILGSQDSVFRIDSSYGRKSGCDYLTQARYGTFQSNQGGGGGLYGDMLFWQYMPLASAETRLLPLSLTGEERHVASAPAGGQVASLTESALRLVWQGKSISFFRVTVTRLDGRKLTVSIIPTCSDLRGARQHWGMPDVRPAADMGDVYR